MARDFLADDFEQPQPSGRDFLWEQEPESLVTAAKLAIPRIGEDLYRGAYEAYQKSPEYLEAAKTEVPGFFNPKNFLLHPLERGKQSLAGLLELGQAINHAPRNIAQYAANRLNLIPKEWADKVPAAPDITEDINHYLGTPKNPGDALSHGIARNALNIIPAAKVASALNPLNLTAKSIAKDVVNTEKQHILSHGKRYKDIWNEAEHTGFNQVPVSQKLLSDNLTTIEKYKTPREYQSLEDFILNPTLENAQKAQSDMGVMHRKLEEKSRSSSLTSEEQALYKAAKDSEKHIEENMFKDSLGNINEGLQDKYKKLTKSYRENVVPYRYNEAIQKYKAKEILPKELVNSLSKGEFAAKKGHKHRAIGIRNNLGPISIGSAIGIAPWLYNELFGTEPTKK
jgi:hypothetical protein